ncbi:Uncharacterised protein g10330 [Pycnogonum litorale]
MATSFSHQELVNESFMNVRDFNLMNRHRRHPVPSEGSDVTISTRIWKFMNGKLMNIAIVTFVIIEGAVILTELLIDLEIIKAFDSRRSPSNGLSRNESTNEESVTRTSDIQIAKDFFKYTSLIILLLFIFEVVMKMASGREKFISDGLQVMDAIVIFVTFGLDVAFLNISSVSKKAYKAAIFIILIRLWRFRIIFDQFVEKSKRELYEIINSVRKDKCIAENKVEMLILTIEDLEHEVAFLKDEAKKYQIGNDSLMKTRDGFSQVTPTSLRKEVDAIGTRTECVIIAYARQKSDEIIERVYDELFYANITTISATPIPRRVPTRKGFNGSPESGYGSAASGFHRPEQALSIVKIDLNDVSDNMFKEKTSSAENTQVVILDEETLAVLDELSEIDRIRQMTFDPKHDNKNVPVTTL